MNRPRPRRWLPPQMHLLSNAIENWPIRIRRQVAVLIFLVAGAAGCITVVAGPYTQWVALKAQNRQLEKTMLVQQAHPLPSAGPDESSPHHHGLDASAWQLAQRLPAGDGTTALLSMVGALAQQHNVLVEVLRPAASIQREHYWLLPVHLRVAGRFHDIAGFAGDIARMPRLAELTDVALTPADGARLALEATLLAAYLPGEKSDGGTVRGRG